MPPAFANAFTELVVYQRARMLAREVVAVSRNYPKEESFALTDQWRRAARSVGAQIAEAWAKRRFPRHFASKLSDADAENFEVQHWIIMAFDAGYLSRDDAQRLGSQSKEIGKMLGSMIENASDFCGEKYSAMLRETPATYFSTALEADPLNTAD
jgi:four helix bundle protein